MDERKTDVDPKSGDPDVEPVVAPPPQRSATSRPDYGRGSSPDLSERREPLYRDAGGYRLRLDPGDLAKLRELPGSKGKTDRELGELFFDGQAGRLAGAISDDVPAPAEVRVVVDPYSRQAFLALGKSIRGIVSF
jgi:hypothetical protein